MFNELYTFENTCALSLMVSFKDSIVCNSNQNSQNKALGMSKSYLRLEVKKGKQLFYSYYVDLDENIKKSDVEKGFQTMKSTLSLE